MRKQNTLFTGVAFGALWLEVVWSSVDMWIAWERVSNLISCLGRMIPPEPSRTAGCGRLLTVSTKVMANMESILPLGRRWLRLWVLGSILGGRAKLWVIYSWAVEPCLAWFLFILMFWLEGQPIPVVSGPQLNWTGLLLTEPRTVIAWRILSLGGRSSYLICRLAAGLDIVTPRLPIQVVGAVFAQLSPMCSLSGSR